MSKRRQICLLLDSAFEQIDRRRWKAARETRPICGDFTGAIWLHPKSRRGTWGEDGDVRGGVVLARVLVGGKVYAGIPTGGAGGYLNGACR